MAQMDTQKEVHAIQIEPADLLLGIRQTIRESGAVYRFPDSEKLISDVLDQTLKETERQLSEIEIAQHAARLYNQIATRSIKFGLMAYSKYASQARTMTKDMLLTEKHRPNRMTRYMAATGSGKKPPNTATHAIVSGTHELASAARKILAKFKIRIDDPANGVYLPKNDNYIPHPQMPDASNHAKIHTVQYYLNITNQLSLANTRDECVQILHAIAKALQEGKYGY
ncbi:AHH domain-containing protein [Pseudoalteromonas sp. MM17-2]|uniref:AHH domain-containing protein n=1 Tax=Pseudoalteromonas sp. MM17-2 TaxID=2917753 RepID=UPI001EF4FAB3|nr:AHH domain-containing protein [Pseudoalteromonas sp. MM17-2]MCG7545724.1 AHH domain-containing protein [Pseudoalteromonas sp. MM17-2]